ncbi:hypothetical protein NY751_14720 [Xanthomonas campestris]|uniref:hypothetical protein n=1 Tax=Xanthomonas campestris TaxID=339 RepID=UPI00235A2AC4|nr:hypothetical protein [Xanthomonas campestris]MDC8747302.1 hypothetical protein [Xanthomonas campestris]
MSEFDDLEDVARVLGDGGQFAPDQTFKSVEELVDALIKLGSTDEVHARHDDYLGLKSDLSEEFLKMHIEDANTQRFNEERERVLEQANIIVPLSRRSLSEDDEDEIEEDRAYRGASSDRHWD